MEKLTQKKLTFEPIGGARVKDNIGKFQMLSEGGVCRLGSGICAEHNVSVVLKRVGCVDVCMLPGQLESVPNFPRNLPFKFH